MEITVVQSTYAGYKYLSANEKIMADLISA